MAKSANAKGSKTRGANGDKPVKAEKAAKSGAKAGAKSGAKSDSKSNLPSKVLSSGGGSRAGGSKSEAFIRLLQSPLVAELVAVAATAAIAALAEQGFTGAGGSRGKRAGQAIKFAGKAGAAAVGRRLGTEIEEIRRSASAATGGAKA